MTPSRSNIIPERPADPCGSEAFTGDTAMLFVPTSALAGHRRCTYRNVYPDRRHG